MKIERSDGTAFESFSEVAERAQRESERAEQEHRRSERLAQKLRELGVDPETS